MCPRASRASRLTGRSGNRYPSGKRKRKSGIRLPLPPRRALRGAGAGPRGSAAVGALRSPAWRRRSCSQPPASGRPLWGSLALVPRGTEVRFCGIWGAEGTPGPWAEDSNRPTSYHPCVSAFGWEGTSQAVRLDKGPLLLGMSDLPGSDLSPACRWAPWTPHHPV